MADYKTLAERQQKSAERAARVLAARRAGKTLQQIADELGVTNERVRQIENRALLAERRAARGEHLP